jgi:hypothetical protein
VARSENIPFRRVFAAVLAVAGLTFPSGAQPVISVPPSSQTNVSIGQVISFAVEVYSTAQTNLQFQWKINGVNIPNATNSTLVIPNAQPTNGGEFSVAISDGQAVVESPYVPLTFDLPLTPGNHFLNRVALTPVTNGVVRSENATATAEANDPVVVSDMPGGVGGKRIWFKWTPTATGIVTFTTLGTGFETLLGAFIGTELTNLTTVPSVVNDDDSAGNLTSKIMFNAISNTEYEIAVDGYWGAFGNVLLSWNEEITQNFLPTFISMPPARMVIPSGASASLVAHWDVGECDWFFNGLNTLDESNTLAIPDTGATNVGKYIIQVSADNGLDTTSSRPARIEINTLDNGTTATGSFAWAKFLDAASSPFVPQLSKAGVQAQDGGDTRGFSVSQLFSTIGDSSEAGEPSVCGQIPAHPGWYVYVAPTNGSMLIHTTGSSFNTVLGVFVGPGNSFSTLTNIGCGYTSNFLVDGQPQVFLSAVGASQTNFIVVDGYHGAKGAVQLNISLGNPITINSPPQNQAVLPGGNATLSVDASGSTPVSYSWQLNGNNIPGATNGSLTVTNVLSGETGTYTVIVSNPISQTNASATLSLITAPIITNEPSSQVVGVGATATFACQASGFGLEYQWLFDGSQIAAATGFSLVLTNAQGTNSGSYICVVANAAGLASSSEATLTVQSLPVIAVQPLSHTVPPAGAGTVSVSAAGTPAPGYEWLFNGSNNGSNTSSLTIANFQSANQGSYAVIVSNSAGSVTSASAILLLDSPLRIGPPSMSGDSFQLQLIGSAGGTFVIQSSTNLKAWTSLLTNNASNGYLNFTDTNAAAFRSRFYRGITN